jgi:hypothetical protein
MARWQENHGGPLEHDDYARMYLKDVLKEHEELLRLPESSRMCVWA